MIARSKPGSAALFLAFNAAAVLFAVLFIFAPILSHFGERQEEISESAAQLSRFENMLRQPKAAVGALADQDSVFLPGNDENIVSADLQAALKSMAAEAGISLLGARGLSSARSGRLHMVAVGLELEGSIGGVRDMMRAIETKTPLLFITSISLHSVTGGDGGPLRAEMTVQGAMRDGQQPDDAEAATQ